MFETVQQAIDWVITRRKSEHTLADFKGYLALKGNPQYQLKCIHVAGTNGKGSTTNYLRSILQNAGYKVGSFTSPHLVTHLDRIRINDENIDGEYFLKMINEHQSEFEQYDLTMFEIDTYISFCYFIDQKVDYAVYEVGLGGRLDPTNVILPMVSVITNIEMDHMAILGNTIAQIAYEKAGIVKDNTDLITFEKKPEALEVFKKACQEHHSQMIQTLPIGQVTFDPTVHFQYRNYDVKLDTYAKYQCLNASVAIDTIDYLVNKGLVVVTTKQLLDGLHTLWAGRFEKVSEDPLIFIDGAHNINGIEALTNSVAALNLQPVFVFSALKDKEYHRMLQRLMEYGRVIVTQFENYRMSSAEQIAQGCQVEIMDDYKQAIETALASGKPVVITGSLYFISIVREYLQQK